MPFFVIIQACNNSIQVSVNGALSCYEKAPEFTSDPFPLGSNRQIIAPFWTDIDTSRRGNIWYHESTDRNFLKRASEEILKVYPETNFTANCLFIATWDHVGYYNSTTTKVRRIKISFMMILLYLMLVYSY